MARDPNVIYDDDASKLTDAELAEFRPTREVLTEADYAAATGRGRPKAADPKVPVTIRLSRSVVETYKATGKGWQTRINANLEKTARAVQRSTVSGRPVTEKNPRESGSATVEDGSGNGGRLTFHRRGTKKIA